MVWKTWLNKPDSGSRWKLNKPYCYLNQQLDFSELVFVVALWFVWATFESCFKMLLTCKPVIVSHCSSSQNDPAKNKQDQFSLNLFGGVVPSSNEESITLTRRSQGPWRRSAFSGNTSSFNFPSCSSSSQLIYFKAVKLSLLIDCTWLLLTYITHSSYCTSSTCRLSIGFLGSM